MRARARTPPKAPRPLRLSTLNALCDNERRAGALINAHTFLISQSDFTLGSESFECAAPERDEKVIEPFSPFGPVVHISFRERAERPHIS